MCVTEHGWKSEDSLQKLVLSLYLVGPRDQTQVIRHGNKFYSPSHLTGPYVILSCNVQYINRQVPQTNVHSSVCVIKQVSVQPLPKPRARIISLSPFLIPTFPCSPKVTIVMMPSMAQLCYLCLLHKQKNTVQKEFIQMVTQFFMAIKHFDMGIVKFVYVSYSWQTQGWFPPLSCDRQCCHECFCMSVGACACIRQQSWIPIYSFDLGNNP